MKTVIDFLSELKDNNNRDWFNENKPRFQEAKLEFEALVNSLINGVAKFDPSVAGLEPKNCVFRIYRDVRFSKDKSPYKTNMGGFIAKGGRKGGFAGYYIHIDPEESFIAGGNHMPTPEKLKKIRQEVMYNIDEFKNILHASDFVKYFGEMEGEKLKKPPRDFPADFADIDLLKFKSFTVIQRIATNTIIKNNFKNNCLSVFEAMSEFNGFLNKAVE